jgi:REase_DpnII-MboI
LILRFHAVVIQLRERHEGRSTLDVNDEYDVQDLLHALLCLQFDDVRPEEWALSYAGKASRVDFLLKPEQSVIEVKKTRQGLAAKEVGDQLIVDIARYSKMSDCKTLLRMVYDPENRIANPGGLQADLSGSKEGIQVEVIIVPKRY